MTRQEVYERRLREYETQQARIAELDVKNMNGDLSNEEFMEMQRLYDRRLPRPVAPIYAAQRSTKPNTSALDAQLAKVSGISSIRRYLTTYEGVLRLAKWEKRVPTGTEWAAIRALYEVAAAEGLPRPPEGCDG